MQITNKTILNYEESRVNKLLDGSNWASVDEWCDKIDEWCEDYELGVFDDMKVENDILYDEILRSYYHKLNDKLDEIAELMYDEWYTEYAQCH